MGQVQREDFGIFISHYTGDRRIAQILQNYLSDSFPSIRAFRSSDADSIPTGEAQYVAILRALWSAKILVILLSPDAVLRQWVAFEAGFGTAARHRIFPFLVRGTQPDEVPSPFSEMMLRPIDEYQVEALTAAVEDAFGIEREAASIRALLRDLGAAESELPKLTLRLAAHVEKPASGSPLLRLALHYEGTRPIELQLVQVSYPAAIKAPDWHPMEMPGHLQVARKQVDGVDCWVLEQIPSDAQPDARFGGRFFRPLHRVLVPPTSEIDLHQLRFVLTTDPSIFTSEFVVHYVVETTTFRVTGDVPLLDLQPYRD